MEEEEEEEEEEEGKIVLGRRLTGMRRLRQGGADSCFPLCFSITRQSGEDIEQRPKRYQTCRKTNTPRPGIEPGSSA